MSINCVMAILELTDATPAPCSARNVAPMVRSATSAPATFRDYVRKLAVERGFDTLAALARAAGTDESTLSRWLGGQNGPSIPALRKLAPHLDVRLGDLMIKAGMATAAELGTKGAPPPPRVSLPPILQKIMSILLDPRVSDRRKQSLVRGVERVVEMWQEMGEEAPPRNKLSN